MKHSIRCGRCGSRRVRRSHTPPGWAQHVRRWTPLRRYACGTCGHRGWTIHPFGDEAVPSLQPAPDPLTPRPLEARDLRQRYARRKTVLRVALVATALGAATAYLILVAGGWGN